MPCRAQPHTYLHETFLCRKFSKHLTLSLKDRRRRWENILVKWHSCLYCLDKLLTYAAEFWWGFRHSCPLRQTSIVFDFFRIRICLVTWLVNRGWQVSIIWKTLNNGGCKLVCDKVPTDWSHSFSYLSIPVIFSSQYTMISEWTAGTMPGSKVSFNIFYLAKYLPHSELRSLWGRYCHQNAIDWLEARRAFWKPKGNAQRKGSIVGLTWFLYPKVNSPREGPGLRAASAYQRRPQVEAITYSPRICLFIRRSSGQNL